MSIYIFLVSSVAVVVAVGRVASSAHQLRSRFRRGQARCLALMNKAGLSIRIKFVEVTHYELEASVFFFLFLALRTLHKAHIEEEPRSFPPRDGCTRQHCMGDLASEVTFSIASFSWIQRLSEM